MNVLEVLEVMLLKVPEKVREHNRELGSLGSFRYFPIVRMYVPGSQT